MVDKLRTLSQLLYPRRCAICGEVVKEQEGKVHKICRTKLTYIRQPQCVKCGKSIDSFEGEYCYDCVRRQYHYVRGFPVFKYDKCMSHSIAEFKYHGKKEYADFYIEEILLKYHKQIESIKPDLILPIPIHNSKRIERGFNQAELIAKGISDSLSIPMDSQLLIRNRKTLPQKQLDDKERLKNLERAFLLKNNHNISKYRRVILVDDIYTTGSTIEACTKVLMSSGVRDVYYVSVCIGQGF